MAGKKTVLIIDDDSAISGIFEVLFRFDGFEARCCDGGISALELSREQCFDVVVTDYDMPGMNGAEITRALRLQCPDALIIGMSAEQRDRDFLTAGAHAFFRKPFAFKDLISVINENRCQGRGS